jgi:hypothetical protein
MCQFDEYINSIIGDLKISKKKKYEMTEEFRDHLQMLKLEYMSKGVSESEAVKKAIYSFGQENSLKKMFANSLLNYRNKITVFIGIVLLLILMLVYRTGGRIPVTGVDTTVISNVHGYAVDQMIFSKTNPILSMILLLLFIPFGYFMPIIFSKIKTAALIGVTLSLGALIGMFLVESAIISFRDISVSALISFIITILLSSLLGSIIGYRILVISNKISLRFIDTISERG